MRIVSLVPSLTKTICDFGLKDQLVGITNFCIDPPDLHRTAGRIGGTKDPDLEKIRDLKPTHIIVNDEENKPEHIEALRSEYRVLSTFPKSPFDVPALLRTMGAFLECMDVAETKACSLEQILDEVRGNDTWPRTFGCKFVYMIWRDPWMVVSTDTYISKFLETLGMRNMVNTRDRYPVVTPSDIDEMNPDVIFMSSEPWPFRQRDAGAWRELTGRKDSPKIFWIDGKRASWYGSTTEEGLRASLEDPRFTREL